MNDKHSPGPWFISNRDIKLRVNGCKIARVNGPDDHFRGSEWREENEICEANARLIAAAPDLLAACELLVKHDDSPYFNDPSDRIDYTFAVDAARDAIAKAKP